MYDGEQIEHPTNLNDRAIAAKECETGAKVLIEDFMPFLNGSVAKYSSRYDDHILDDLRSTAMIAFYEAIRGYDALKGHFFPFAKRVVSVRIIDHLRKIGKHEGRTVSISEDGDEHQPSQLAINVISMRNYDVQRRQERLVDEIEQFKSEAAFWGITMEALVKSSPKHKELRKTYKEIVAVVIKSDEIMQTIHLKRYFPIKAISEITGIPHKKLERARTFLIASLIIKSGDYDLLSEYVK